MLVGLEHMRNATMFTLNDEFADLNLIVDKLRTEHRATVLELLPAVGNNTQNYPFSEGVSRERYWIMENFFSSGVVGKVSFRNELSLLMNLRIIKINNNKKRSKVEMSSIRTLRWRRHVTGGPMRLDASFSPILLSNSMEYSW